MPVAARSRPTRHPRSQDQAHDLGSRIRRAGRHRPPAVAGREDCRRRCVSSAGAREGIRRRVPASLRRVWSGALAVLRGVQRPAPRAAASLVRPVRRALAECSVHLRSVPACLDRSSTSAVRVRWSRPGGRAPSEVPRGQRGGPGTGIGHGDPGASRARGRRRHLGPAREAAQGRARVRSGQGARGRRRRPGRPAGSPVAAADRRDRPAGQARRLGSSRSDAWVVRSGRRASEPRDHVLLVDDVLTTGATAGACAEALLANGSARVSVLVAARTLLRTSRPAYTRAGPRPGLWLPGDDLR